MVIIASMSDEISILDKNGVPCMLGIDPNGNIKMVTVDSNGVLGSGTPYPITGDEVALRDKNQNPCSLINAGGFVVNLRLNDSGKIIF